MRLFKHLSDEVVAVYHHREDLYTPSITRIENDDVEVQKIIFPVDVIR